MTQDAVLFDDTIYQNLVYGLDREPSDEEVQQALAAVLPQFVDDLPRGLETRVGDGGYGSRAANGSVSRSPGCSCKTPTS